MPSRRRVLQGCGVALSTALAGCAPSGPRSVARLEAAVEAPFESAAPYEVPASVRVRVESVDSTDAGVRGLALVALDEDREPLASTSLPVVTYESASAAERTVESPTGDRDEAVYAVETTFERTVTVERFPTWLSLQADRVWAGEDGAPEQAENRLPLSAPPPPVEVISGRYRGGRPLSDTVEPGDYERDARLAEFGSFDEVLLPPLTSTPEAGTAALWHALDERGREPLATVTAAFRAASRHDVATTTERPLADALERADDDPHLLVAPHDEVNALGEFLLEPDHDEELRVNLDGAYLSPTPDAGRVEGSTVGVPLWADTVALLYDRERVSEPPATSADLLSLAADHHDPDSGRYGLAHPLTAQMVVGWVDAFGGYMYDPDSGELGLTEPETVRGLRFVLEELRPLGPDDAEIGAHFEAFRSGAAPLLVGVAAVVPDLRSAGIDVGVVPLPAVDGTRPVPDVFVSSLLLTREVGRYQAGSPADAARAFARWHATTDERPGVDVASEGVVPVRRRATVGGETAPATAGFVDAVEGGRLEPTDPRYQAVQHRLFGILPGVADGEVDLEPALVAAEEDLRDRWDE